MPVSKAIVPLLKGDAAKSFWETFTASRLKPYTDEEREATDRAILAILEKRNSTEEKPSSM